MQRLGTLYLLMLLIVIAAFLRVDFVIYVAYVVGGILLLSTWLTPRQLKGLKIKRRFHPNAFLGEKVPVKIEIENTSRFSMPWLQVQEMTPTQLRSGTNLNHAVFVPGRDSAELEYTVRAMRRGYYQVGPLRMEAGDIFGFRTEAAVFPSDYITVYPDIVPLNRLRLPSRLPFGTLPGRQRIYEDPARPTGVRHFRSGDSLRQVNWKVSARYASSGAARGSGLMVKTLDPAISLETLIVLDLNTDAWRRQRRLDGVEWGIVVAASLAAHLNKQRQPAGLACNGYDPLSDPNTSFDENSGRLISSQSNRPKQQHFLKPANGRAHLMKVLELLARVDGNASTPIADFLPKVTVNLSWGTTVLVATADASAATTDACHRLLRSGYNPILLVIEPTGDIGSIRERARRLGFLAFGVFESADLELAR